ncbi:MAG: (d)CMP kinase [Pirellulaceae bacterium]|nr:(d)CMP kinase [Pirellulaceae bacterium]
MIVTIDGPAGAGKSSIARRLAERIGFQFLDTGAMYRAVTLAALRAGLGDCDAPQIAALAETLAIDLAHERTILNGEDVSAAIRTSDVSAAVYLAADNLAVRRRLVKLQRQIAGSRDTVTEGRDQGTVAFPQAECKIFLTASPEERARRRHAELAARGEGIFEVWTDGLGPDEVIDRLEKIVREKMPKVEEQMSNVEGMTNPQ